MSLVVFMPNTKYHYKSCYYLYKFDSHLVNADWLITWQETFDYVHQGAVDGLLNECIRRYFFPSRAKEAKKQKKINAWSQVKREYEGHFHNRSVSSSWLGHVHKFLPQTTLFSNVIKSSDIPRWSFWGDSTQLFCEVTILLWSSLVYHLYFDRKSNI